jgi:heme/copper-type cytochrome/quinol oxidase subunit 3
VTTVATVDSPPAPEAAHAQRNRSTGVWGMAVLIMTEATIFAGLLSSYFFLRASAKEWPLGDIDPPELQIIAVFTVILLGSSGPLFWAERGLSKGELWRLKAGLILVLLMGTAFLCFQMIEYIELGFGVRDNAYGSVFYTITGLHGLHVFGGLLMIGMVLIKAFMGKVSAERHVTVQVVSLYWHFVDVVWVFVFTSLYLSAHMQ